MKDNIREKFEVIQGYEGFEQGIISPTAEILKIHMTHSTNQFSPPLDIEGCVYGNYLE